MSLSGPFDCVEAIMVDVWPGLVAVASLRLPPGRWGDAEDLASVAVLERCGDCFAARSPQQGCSNDMSDVRAALYRRVLNLARNARRSSETFPQGGEGAWAGDVPGREASPNETAVQRERADVLHQSLSGLSSSDRELLICRYSLGLSVEETARVLKMRKGSVKSGAWRAIRKLERMPALKKLLR